MRSSLILFFLIISSQFSFAQCDTNRYVNPIFTDVYKHADVKYGEAPVWTIPYNNTDLFMDIYEPIGDVLTKRPLMLWVHPGGFLLGDKEADDMVALCDSFARRGYVTASIGYRLGFNPVSATSAERATYRATQDGRAAIRYLMEYSDIYGIDTNYVFVGGSSAGGFVAVHIAYGDQDEAPSSISGGLIENDLGCLDCAGNNYVHDVNLSGVVNLWGALGDSAWVDADETVPALLIHGTADDVVPFGYDHPFGVFTTPLTSGSRCIHNQLDFHGIDHDYLFFEGEGHEPHGAGNGSFAGITPTPYWDTIFYAVRDHYFAQLQPDSQGIIGATAVSALGEAWYYVNTNSNDSTCWTIQNGTALQNLRDSVLVQWTPGFNNGEVSVRIINEVEAVSSETSLSVTISNSVSLPVIPESENSFVIYPNPAETEISLSNISNGAKVIVTDAIGKELVEMENVETDFSIDIEEFQTGVYFVTVIYGNNFQTKRFVKK